jgi:hypothetical protein
MSIPDEATAWSAPSSGGISMIANALFAAAVICLATVFVIAGRADFLLPYRALLLHGRWKPVLFSLAVAFSNLTALFFYAARICFLKDTGRKLAHFDRDLNTGRTPMASHLHRGELN